MKRLGVGGYEAHMKAASPWFSQARGHSQFKVPPVTLNDSHVSSRLVHSLRSSGSKRWIRFSFVSAAALGSPESSCVKRCRWSCKVMSEDAEAAGKPALFGGAQGFCAAVIPQLIPCCFVFTWPSDTDR